MEDQEWANYVRKVATGAWPVPAGLIRNQNDWLCRSIVGRALYFKGELEEAMLVLSTVLEEEPDLQEVPVQGLSQSEHKVLCLRDLGEIIYQLTHNRAAALQYFEQARALSQSYPHPFHTEVRVELLQRIKELKLPERLKEDTGKT